MNAIRINMYIYNTAWSESRYPFSRDPGSGRGRFQLNFDGNADTYYTVALYILRIIIRDVDVGENGRTCSVVNTEHRCCYMIL